MTGAVFLSASVPDPASENFHADADSVAVASAVKALVYVLLGRRKLVWGGHPAITPMVAAAASSLNVDYQSWVTLYQSRYFLGEFPEENTQFDNVVLTKKVDNSLSESLALMRHQMFSDHTFSCGIFIGGMKGVVAEFELLHEICPQAKRIPVISTGGATTFLAEIANHSELDLDRLSHDIDYVPLMHDLCDVSYGESRLQYPKGHA